MTAVWLKWADFVTPMRAMLDLANDGYAACQSWGYRRK
jgi:hypothetical protein